MAKLFDRRALLAAAKDAKERAYCKYSGFSVGAAVLCENGKVYCGFNVENSGYSPTICAERVAFCRALYAGETKFVAVAVVGGKKGDGPYPVYPCGVCRQFMAEFVDADFLVITQNKDGEPEEKVMGYLLPEAFELD